jgi:GxxExxY protein
MKPGNSIMKPGIEEARNGDTKLEHEELTGKIIGAAIEVHRALGPGFIESIYERALVIALRKRGLKVEQQVEVRIYFDGEDVGAHRLDLFVENEIVVDLKAIKDFTDLHFAIVKSQLRAADRRHGLLLNFAKPTLEITRVICD